MIPENLSNNIREEPGNIKAAEKNLPFFLPGRRDGLDNLPGEWYRNGAQRWEWRDAG